MSLCLVHPSQLLALCFECPMQSNVLLFLSRCIIDVLTSHDMQNHLPALFSLGSGPPADSQNGVYARLIDSQPHHLVRCFLRIVSRILFHSLHEASESPLPVPRESSEVPPQFSRARSASSATAPRSQAALPRWLPSWLESRLSTLRCLFSAWLQSGVPFFRNIGRHL